jgi:hypothetical protein
MKKECECETPVPIKATIHWDDSDEGIGYCSTCGNDLNREYLTQYHLIEEEHQADADIAEYEKGREPVQLDFEGTINGSD